MTDNTNSDPYFDVRRSVRGRNLARLIIAPLFSAGLIWFGTWLLPEQTVVSLSVEAIKTWNVWSFLGIIAIGSGIYGLAKELVFAVRAWSTTGEWHFRLTELDLLWHVPDHAHGKEEGFEASLKELVRIEFRAVEKTEGIDEREYWVHFRAREPVQLRSFSGVSLPWLVERISAAGVPYQETRENY